MIELRNLTKLYRTEEVETSALNDVSLRIGAGEFVSVMGPSGCGKSTFLNILGLLDTASAGQHRFLGDDVSRLSERTRAVLRKENIGFIFQNFNLIEELTVFENVELPLCYLKLRASQRRSRVEPMLDRMGLMPRRDHFPGQLSGGQQQRAALARALVTAPKLILADEPTGNLDSRNGRTVMTQLRELHDAGTTIVMVTHNESDAGFADRTVRLLDGSIVPDTGPGPTDV